ncbi:hypothetical protein BJ875DRAFT_439524 [Amylocarpus encephaloides]|uniref:Uncharacterized protein n=1 Tax=Amylocarpus encephaloides TaxID=45428 RepID=A0A9P7YNM0_9HELO|nr:hypothetical protein BJ875DRAFT_439524 [Amylocarpus encephaloides]
MPAPRTACSSDDPKEEYIFFIWPFFGGEPWVTSHDGFKSPAARPHYPPLELRRGRRYPESAADTAENLFGLYRLAARTAWGLSEFCFVCLERRFRPSTLRPAARRQGKTDRILVARGRLRFEGVRGVLIYFSTVARVFMPASLSLVELRPLDPKDHANLDEVCTQRRRTERAQPHMPPPSRLDPWDSAAVWLWRKHARKHMATARQNATATRASTSTWLGRSPAHVPAFGRLVVDSRLCAVFLPALSWAVFTRSRRLVRDLAPGILRELVSSLEPREVFFAFFSSSSSFFFFFRIPAVGKGGGRGLVVFASNRVLPGENIYEPYRRGKVSADVGLRWNLLVSKALRLPNRRISIFFPRDRGCV